MDHVFLQVVEALEAASSQQAVVLKPAEIKLQEWEKEKGFYSILLNVFSNPSIQMNVRWLAVLYLKNGVDRYWRKNAPNAICEEEKHYIREGLLALNRESVKPLAIQLAVLIAKIARMDCPREWSELIPTLVTNVESSDSVVTQCALLLLHHVVKSLSSKRLAGDRRLFQELTDSLLPFIKQKWDCCILQLDNDISCEMALLCLRILRKLLVHGLKKPHESLQAKDFLMSLLQHLPVLLATRKEALIIHSTKVLLDLLEYHPFSFVCILQPSLTFATTTAFSTEQHSTVVFERLLIQCLNIIKMVLLCAEYKPPKYIEDTKEPLVLEARSIIQSFFSDSTLQLMCTKLVGQYFPLTKDDLQLWDDNPEGFAVDEGGESWKYSLRPCTESLFICLFREFREVLTPTLLTIIRENTGIVDVNNLSAILHKDAIYSAIGLAAFDLFDDVDFDEWLCSTLLREASITGSHYRILRRRVAWLIGEWVGVKLSVAMRPNVYECLVALMQPNEDIVVRLAAANSLKMCVDNFEFSCEQFRPYLKQSIDALFLMLKQTKEADCKMQVLHVVSFVIERMGPEVAPYSQALGLYLPELWNEVSDQHMLQCAILSVFIQLIRAVGNTLTPLVLEAVSNATDINGPSHIYLMEDGLELWLALVENTKDAEQVMRLYDKMPPILEQSSEHLRICLQITQAYILLNPEPFLQTYGRRIATVLDEMMSDMRNEGIIMICRVIETALKVAPETAAQAFIAIVPKVISGVLNKEESPILMGMYVSIIARLIISSTDTLQQCLTVVGASLSLPSTDILGYVLDIWLDRMNLITQIERRKLLSVALVSLITAATPVVGPRIHMLLLNVAETLHDVASNDDPNIEGSVDVFVSDNSVDNIDETEHEKRKRQASQSDTVHRIGLAEVVKSQMLQLHQQIGNEAYAELLDTVDAETLQHLRNYSVI